ncbi:hypothetical protein SFR_0734 [Streptomyces sp. FR-008]|nr:hypothetical protein SFR_0734 [Streptomyces sp. FR-008]
MGVDDGGGVGGHGRSPRGGQADGGPGAGGGVARPAPVS